MAWSYSAKQAHFRALECELNETRARNETSYPSQYGESITETALFVTTYLKAYDAESEVGNPSWQPLRSNRLESALRSRRDSGATFKGRLPTPGAKESDSPGWWNVAYGILPIRYHANDLAGMRPCERRHIRSCIYP